MSLAHDLSIVHNPVTRAELTHLQRSQPAQRFVRFWARRFVLTIAVIWSLTIIGIHLSLATSQPEIYESQNLGAYDWMLQPLIALTALALVIHFSTLYRTLTIGGNTIVREKEVGAWENIILTRIGSRRLILGKWWAVVRMTWRDFAVLGIIRAGAVVGFGTMILANHTSQLLVLTGEKSSNPAMDILLAPMFVMALTVVNGLFTAAAGVTGSLLTRSNSPGVLTAQAIRMGTALIPVVIMLPIIIYAANYFNSLPDAQADAFIQQWNPLLFFQLNFIDNGAIGAATLANPLDGGGNLLIGVMTATVLIYGLLTLFLLKVGQWLARRQGMTA
jgi:hypothetical protein